MPKILAEMPGIKIVTDDGTTHEFRLAYDTAETSCQPLVLLHCYINDVLVGTSIRHKAAGNRIAADLPGVDPTYFITEDGHIANG